MSINSSGNKRVKTNVFDKDAFFALWFWLINTCFLGVGVCKNDQGIINQKKAEKICTGGANKSDTGGTMKLDISGANKPNLDGVNKPGKSIADNLGINAVNKPGISKTNIKKNPVTGKKNAKKTKRQLAKTQVADLMSFLSFCKVFYFFFSSLKLEIFGFLSCFF